MRKKNYRSFAMHLQSARNSEFISWILTCWTLNLSLDNDTSSVFFSPVILVLWYSLGKNQEAAEFMIKTKQCLVITWINVSLTGMTFPVYRIFKKSRSHNMYWSSMQLKSILCHEIDFPLWYFCVVGVNAEYNLHLINGIVHHQMKNIFNLTAVSSCLKP